MAALPHCRNQGTVAGSTFIIRTVDAVVRSQNVVTIHGATGRFYPLPRWLRRIQPVDDLKLSNRDATKGRERQPFVRLLCCMEVAIASACARTSEKLLYTHAWIIRKPAAVAGCTQLAFVGATPATQAVARDWRPEGRMARGGLFTSRMRWSDKHAVIALKYPSLFEHNSIESHACVDTDRPDADSVAQTAQSSTLAGRFLPSSYWGRWKLNKTRAGP